jgi:hypothetical protein
VSREVEGLPWPEGDPDGLRGIAQHAVGLAGELESRQGFLKGLDPIGWIGAGRDEFAVSLAEHSHALGAAISAMHTASAALFKLAQTVEDAQHKVLDAARKLKAARDAAARAASAAASARTAAQNDPMKLLVAPLSTPGAPVQTPLEQDAVRAENAAVDAADHALDVERWAHGQADDANHAVQREDRACADALEGAGLVQNPGSPALICAAPPAADPLATLGALLLGSAGSSTGGGLNALLSSPPPPPPPPPPKPAEHHHSWLHTLAVGGMGVVTGGLVVVDALQLGLDPATDGLTVAAGGETAALATDAAVDTEVAATATEAEGAAITETTEGLVASEGAPAEGLKLEQAASRGWQRGDDIYAPTRAGNEPNWNTVRARYWKNVANDPEAASQWDETNLARMRTGRAPQRFNPDKPGTESMELSHEPVPQRDGGRDVVPRWPQDHAAVDPFRHPGY